MALEKLDWQIDVITHWSNPNDPPVQKLGRGSRVIRFDAGNRGFESKNKLFQRLPKFLQQATEFFKKHNNNYELIHSHYWLSGWVGRHLKKQLGVPQIHTSHSLGLVKKRSLGIKDAKEISLRLEEEKRIFDQAVAIIATSPEEKKQLILGYRVSPQKIHIIPCGVEVSRFRVLARKELRKQLQAEGKKIILFVGRFVASKGLEVLIQSLSLLFQHCPELAPKTRLWIIGGDPLDVPLKQASAEKQELVRLIERMRLRDNICFLGPKSHEELPNYYNAADVCVVPSYYESFGLVAVEAMACGCPVIASRVGGLRYTVREGKTGLLVPPRSPEALAKAVARILLDDILRKRMARQAATYVSGKFNWNAVAKRVNNLYQEVIECNQPREKQEHLSS
ncbi:glycosyltransferase [Calderihabitans maritimus]|uniref:Glycosyltransferase n=2 Tax=Calderihabitans maritimus TaxID=1246530 RepID=A0A1Z5HSQ4_9FIRM|nr:glycosyltransferase [Calderihabitans maritimus]